MYHSVLTLLWYLIILP